eukprot:358273_1
MSTNELSTEWINLCACPITDYMTIPTGIDANNYIVIDRKFAANRLNCIYKYNINTNKWSKLAGLNVLKDFTRFNAAMDVRKQVLYLFHSDYLTQIQTNSHYIDNITYDNAINKPQSVAMNNTTSIIINNSAFVFSCGSDVLKWNPESQTVTKFCDMYNKILLNQFGIICNKNNCLLFGGYTNVNFTDCILELNIQTKQWNKLPVSLPKKIHSICCTMAINNTYVLLFGGHSYCILFQID